jgi:hypothetical protein
MNFKLKTEKEKTLIARCKNDERYHYHKKNLILTLIISTILPLVFSIVIAKLTSDPDIFSFVHNGELVLVLYAVIVDICISLILMKRAKIIDDYMVKTLHLSSLLQILIDLGIYIYLRACVLNTTPFWDILISFLITIAVGCFNINLSNRISNIIFINDNFDENGGYIK